MSDTICAIATAPGGALGIVRISGDDAINIVSRIFTPAGGGSLSSIETRRATFGIVHAFGNKKEIIDEAVATSYAAPYSYTGENAVELSCHGSAYILEQVIRLLTEQGCRTARPGEFTQRAFLNGKMDLSQAEAVADLVAAHSSASHRVAISQLRGSLRREIESLRQELLRLRSLIELQLDFSDHEDLSFANQDQLIASAQAVLSRAEALASTFRAGNALRRGIPVAIVGSPNAGKSTLMNALLGDDRSIVSSTAGTTRDTIEDEININGIEFRLIDTAGLRQPQSSAEQMGISRAHRAIATADVVVWVMSCQSRRTPSAPKGIAPQASVIVALNKCDLLNSENQWTTKAIATQEKVTQVLGRQPSCVVAISALRNKGINKLKDAIANASGVANATMEGNIAVSQRHHDALIRAADSIKQAINHLRDGVSPEIVSLDLRQAEYSLADIAGATTPQDVLNNIFAHFCIGK